MYRERKRESVSETERAREREFLFIEATRATWLLAVVTLTLKNLSNALARPILNLALEANLEAFSY